MPNFSEFFEIKKPLKLNKSKFIVFTVTANDMDILPFFLDHYRLLNVSQFFFLVDKSDDGTFEYLMNQSDVGIITSKLNFGQKISFKIFSPEEKVITNRAGIFFKYIIPHTILQNNWVLIADTDEILELPKENNDFFSLIEDLNHVSSKSCRALMVDMFPKNLQELKLGENRPPVKYASYYNPPKYSWPEGHSKPTRYDLGREVRTLITRYYYKNLGKTNDQSKISADIKNYKYPAMFKTPLAFWTSKTFVNAHFCSQVATSKIQVALRHYHFRDNLVNKVKSAIEEKQYYNTSQNYVHLGFVIQSNPKLNLVGPQTKKFLNKKSFCDDNICFNQL